MSIYPTLSCFTFFIINKLDYLLYQESYLTFSCPTLFSCTLSFNVCQSTQLYPALYFFSSKKTGLSSVSRVLFLPSPILIYLNFILSFVYFPHFALHYLLFFVISSLKTLDCLFHQASRSGNPYISSSYSCVSYSCLKIHQSASYDTLSYH